MEPPLKHRNPVKSKNAPSATSGMLWPGIGITSPPGENLKINYYLFSHHCDGGRLQKNKCKGSDCAVARELFLDRGGKSEIAKIGNAKQRSTLELENLFVPKTSVLQKKGLRRIWSIFLARKHRFSKKKVFRLILERFLVPNMAHDTGLRGSKSRPEGRPLPPTSRAYAIAKPQKSHSKR